MGKVVDATPEQTAITESILAQFNFKKVQKAMKAVKWGYWDSTTPPSLEKLVETARSLVIGIQQSKKCTAYGTGGFYAIREKNELGHEYFRLEFVLENASNDYIED